MVDVRRSIFQGYSLSPLLFVICMILLTQILREVELRYTLKNRENLNCLLFMDDIKIFAKSEPELNELVSTVQILSNDVGMESGVKEYGIIILKRG